MNQLSQFDIDEIISYCDLKTKSRLNVVMKNIVLSTTIIDKEETITQYIFEHNGLTIFIETSQNKQKFRLDQVHGYERMIDHIWYVKDRFHYGFVTTLYRYLNAILSILSNNPIDLTIDIRDEHIGLLFDYGKTIYGGNVHRYIGAELVKRRST